MAQSKNKGVLVVDDEKIIREISLDFLAAEGFCVFVAESTAKARDLLSQHQTAIDIIIIDLMMPDEGGLEFFEKLKEGGCQTPVVILTGFPSVETCRIAFKMGVIDYITKPFKIDDLVSLINEVLERAQ